MFTPNNIYHAFMVFFSITIILKIVFLLLNINFIKKNQNIVPAQFAASISLAEHQKAASYTVTRNQFQMLSLVFHAAVLIVWLNWGLTYLYNLLASFGLPDASIHFGVYYIIIFNLINSFISIPESLYSTFVIEEKFGFNKMSLKLYVLDFFKQFMLSMIIGIPLMYALIYLLIFMGENWWLYAWLLLISFQFVIIWAYPKFIAPLFNKFSPLEKSELVDKIKKLCKACQLNFKEYYIMNASLRSSHGNAYFTGFGKNKRIVFYDTLIKTLEDDEVIAVLAHELGHYKKKHIQKSICIALVVLFISFFILGKLSHHPAFFEAFNSPTTEPFMAFLLFMMIGPFFTYLATPFSSYFSRKNEYEADTFAANYANPKDLISALIKMYKDNSSSLTPHPWYSKFYFSHPPANERVQLLETFIHSE